jgi:hypothetical protein
MAEGKTFLPVSAPVELSEGSSSNGICSRVPTERWKPPNSALVEVLLPDSATPIQPRIGASTTNQVPTREKPYASVLGRVVAQVRPAEHQPGRWQPPRWGRRRTSNNAMGMRATRVLPNTECRGLRCWVKSDAEANIDGCLPVS